MQSFFAIIKKCCDKKAHRRRMIFLIILMVQLIQNLYIPAAFADGQDYTIDNGYRFPVPKTYVLSKVINNSGNIGTESGYLKEPEDLFINSKGFVFIADTGNNRIVKLNSEGFMTGVFKGPDKKPLKSPKGVFADDEGNMYIADTGNERIVHLSAEGEFVEEFLKPDSELLGKSFRFDPSKLYVSPTGYIYVVKGQTIMTIDAYNRFRGYLGQTDIGFNLVEAMLRVFASDEQKRVIRKRTVSTYTNLTIDDSGMIYATAIDTSEGEIKKLNSIGNNIYKKYGKTTNKIVKYLKELQIKNKSFVFGERRGDDGNNIKPVFNDIAVDKDRIVSVIEGQTGKVYQYDQEGNLLAVFGGKDNQIGKFNSPTSINVDNKGRIYILDRRMGNIQIFEPTDFILRVHKAINAYSNGDYDNAYKVWTEVLKIDENYQLAHEGLAKALYKQENWKASMEEYLQAEDRDGYSKAFSENRYALFRKYFFVVVLASIIAVILLLLLIMRIRKIADFTFNDFKKNKEKRLGTIQGLKLSLAAVFHPLETFDLIKSSRGRLNAVPGLIILAIFFATRLFYVFVIHYPLQVVDLKDSNLALEMVRMLLPVLTWVVASFGVTAIMDGESKIDEIFLSSAFCTVPYILVNIPLVVVSRILARNEITFFIILRCGAFIWVLLLFFISLMKLNNYSMKKTFAIYAISGVTMVLIWAIGLSGYVLTGRLYQFFAGIAQEVRML